MVSIYFDTGNDERCCICRNDTQYWTKTHVALCENCAKSAVPDDLPSQEEWIRREEIAESSVDSL